MKKQDLTFGMFGSDGECKADDLTSEDVQTTVGIKRMGKDFVILLQHQAW